MKTRRSGSLQPLANAGQSADNAQNSDALTNRCDGLKAVKGSIPRSQSEREGVIASNSLRSRHQMRQGDAVPPACPGHNKSVPCSILICGPPGRRIVCNTSIKGASNKAFEKTTRAPGALQSIRRDDSKRSFTVTYHTLTVTVARISNLYQACYRCTLPGKTAQNSHRVISNSCSPKLESSAALSRPLSTSPKDCAPAAIEPLSVELPCTRDGVREIGLWPLRISSRDVSRIMHCRSTVNPLCSLPDPPVAKNSDELRQQSSNPLRAGAGLPALPIWEKQVAVQSVPTDHSEVAIEILTAE